MDIWNRIHESGVATLEEFPDLATASYRDELAANAARLGLKFSFELPVRLSNRIARSPGAGEPVVQPLPPGCSGSGSVPSSTPIGSRSDEAL